MISMKLAWSIPPLFFRSVFGWPRPFTGPAIELDSVQGYFDNLNELSMHFLLYFPAKLLGLDIWNERCTIRCQMRPEPPNGEAV
jgi:hypothetical protein